MALFAPTCLLQVTDVIFSLRSLCLQTLASRAARHLLPRLPLDVLEEVMRLAELRRKSAFVWSVEEASEFSVVQLAALSAGLPSLFLRWSSIVEMSMLFDLSHTPFCHLTQLRVFGVAALPMAAVVVACPRLEVLEVRCVEAETIFAPVARLHATLRSLCINTCPSAFNAVADGAHDWMKKLTGLEELNLRYTSVSAKMLPPLANVRSLDISFTFCHDLVELAPSLSSVEFLCIGDDAMQDTSQLYIVPKISKHWMPALKRLDMFVPILVKPNETKSERRALLGPLVQWATERRLMSLRVYVDQAPTEMRLNESGSYGLLFHTLQHDLANPKPLVLGALGVGWRLHRLAEREVEVPRDWLVSVFGHLLEGLALYRGCLSQLSEPRGALPTIVMMLMVMCRFDHMKSSKMGLGVQVMALPVMSHLIMLLRDAVRFCTTLREYELANNIAGDESKLTAPRTFVVMLLRLMTLAFDMAEIERTMQASLIRMGVAELISEAIDDNDECLYYGLVIFGTLSSCQPFKATLLSERLCRILLRILTPNEDYAPLIRESATTVLGNLSSWAPNTHHLMAVYPQLLHNLIELLVQEVNDSFGCTYLLGNLSYIAPSLCGNKIFQSETFRKRTRLMFETAFAGVAREGFTPLAAQRMQTKLFWNLWARCHARDTFQECNAEKELPPYVEEHDRALARDLDLFCSTFGSSESILCLWTNLIGVRRLMSSTLICIRAFSLWLIANISYQPKHRPKLASAFSWFFPVLCNDIGSATVGSQMTEGGEAWSSKQRAWLGELLGYMVECVTFARPFLDQRDKFRHAASNVLELDARLVAKLLKRAEELVDEENRQKMEVENFFV